MTHPLGWGELLAYFVDELPANEAAAIEEHLFTCDACSERASQLHDTGAGLVELIRRGMLSGQATIALLNRCSRDRLQVRRYIVYPGEVVACTVTSQDEFLLAHLMLDRPPQTRVDMAMLDDRGEEINVIQDVVVEARGNQVLSFIPARPVQDQPSGKLQYVLFAVDQGRREVIGRYTLDHTAMREA